MTEPLFPARVVAIRYEATDVLSFSLKPQGWSIERIDPGSHIDIALPNGAMRSYSLSNGPRQTDHYRLTIARDARSRGGSVYLHDTLRVGEIVQVSKPRNNFELDEHARLSVFFAGGIGVTPFIPMIARLNELGQRWRLHYSVRTRDRAGLLAEIEALAADGAGELVTNFDEEPGGAMLDLRALIALVSADTHIYCCGPIGMLDAFRASATALPPEQVHFEYFSSNVQSSVEGGFTVVLAKSGAELSIVPGQTILTALLEHGLNVPYSCEEGICGSCEVGVISGEIDHRDMVLSGNDRAENRTMMVCCSGSKSARLVLDL